MYTRTELKKLHKQFWHPSAGKMYNLIKRVKPESVNEDTMQTLKDIAKACDTCSVYSKGPHRLRVTFTKDKCVFNHELALDLVWLEGDPALHVLDTHTHLSAAIFLLCKSTKDVWNAFLVCWATVFVGYPDLFKVDQDSVFTSREWRKLSEDAGIGLKVSGVESHNALGVGERYHAPLRRLYLKIRRDVPNMDRDLALKIANKAMNDTMGPEGLVPTLLVYGALPRFSPSSTDLPGHVEKMEAMEIARLEYTDITAKLKIQQALRSNLPPATKYLVSPGDSVYVYKEKEKRWRGPYTVTKTLQRQVWVQRPDKEAQYSLDHVLPVEEADGTGLLSQVFFALKQYKSDKRQKARVFLTEYLEPRDPRQDEPEFVKAKLKEIEGLAEQGTYEVEWKEDVPKGSNVLGGRFVLCIKNKGSGGEGFKARFVVQGHRDREKSRLVHTSSNLRQSSVRLLTALAAVLGFRVWSQDVTQAYLQSADKLMRDIYVKPAKEFRLSEGQLLKLLKPLYGLTDAGDYWDVTMTRHLKEDLEMTQACLDISLFFKRVQGKLTGLSGMYVDDGIHAGNAKFLEECDKTQTKFKSKPRDMDHFVFAGIQVEYTSEGIRLHQEKYAKSIKPLATDCTYREYRSCRQKLQWLVHTRPDIACAVNKSTQVTEKAFGKQKFDELNKIVNHVHRNPGRGLLQRKLDLQTMYMRVYADGSFADNEDLTTQLGYLVFLCDASGSCNIVQYSSHKSRRVVRSVLGGETYAFADGLDYGLSLKHDLEQMLGRKLGLRMFTDSKSLFDVISKNSTTTEKRLMVDVQAMREAYERMELSDVAWVKSEDNPADSLTKVKENAVLNRIVDEGKVDHDIQQWVIRKTKEDSEQKDNSEEED